MLLLYIFLYIGEGLAETLLFLARYEKDKGEYDRSEMYCRRLLDLPSTSEKNEAKAMLRELNQLKSGNNNNNDDNNARGGGRRRSSRLGRNKDNNGGRVV